MAAVAVLTLSVAACNGPSIGSREPSASGPANPFSTDVSGALRTSGFNPGDEVGQSRADYAAEQLGGVTVTMDKTNFDPQKFAAQAASGQTPDLIQTDRAIVATLANKDLIIPLDQCYEAFGVKPREQYYPSVVDDVSYDGKIYGIPQFFQANALLANKRVLDQAGVAAAALDTSKPDELVATAKKLYQEKGGKPTVIGVDADLPGSSGMWFTVFGGAAYDEQGKPTLDRPENVAALTWMKQLMDAQGGYAKVKSFKDSMDVFGAGNQYVKDQVAVQTWAQWYPNVLADTKDKVSLEAVPIKDSSGAPIAMAGGTSFAIPKSGKNPSAACAWAIKATSSEAWMAAADARIETVEKNKKLFTGLMTGSPVADQQIKDKYVKPTGNAEFDQVIETYYAVLAKPVTSGSSPVGQTVQQDLTNAVTVALTGEKTPEQALADAQTSSLRAWEQATK
ncbi:ABC transporter substrate-binding protein [Microlunatus sp. GCM10028923]|uniref:ABC transporter substrate-binding protein n=1 Tax=Microlunatus sp. GCM10028923 TaxID=3273400 RepID=UPI00360D9C06